MTLLWESSSNAPHCFCRAGGTLFVPACYIKRHWSLDLWGSPGIVVLQFSHDVSPSILEENIKVMLLPRARMPSEIKTSANSRWKMSNIDREIMIRNVEAMMKRLSIKKERMQIQDSFPQTNGNRSCEQQTAFVFCMLQGIKNSTCELHYYMIYIGVLIAFCSMLCIIPCRTLCKHSVL